MQCDSKLQCKLLRDWLVVNQSSEPKKLISLNLNPLIELKGIHKVNLKRYWELEETIKIVWKIVSYVEMKIK